MIKRIWEAVFNMITSRLLLLYIVFIAMALILIYRIFDLQIIRGESYLNNFQLKIQKVKTIEGTRGNIRDRNGKLLAYNELAYSVTIEDVYESNSKKNERLNGTLSKLIKIIESNGDSIISDFNIIIDDKGDYEFTVEGSKKKRFIADVYGVKTTDKLKYEQETASAYDVMEYLCNRYKIGENVELESGDTKFVPMRGYSPKECLQLVTIRYQMSLYSFSKYITTTIAYDVSKETVAVVMENLNEMDGVAIEEDTIRRYNYPFYFSHILGYTGKIDQDELDYYSTIDSDYNMNDTIGKGGIEQVMELELQGKKGKETLYVDNLGRVLDTDNLVEPKAGNDLYLTIDADLQVAVYNIVEQKLAGILVSKIQNRMNYDPSTASSASNIIIPIDDVYFALINNSVIDISHFADENATETEREVYHIFLEKQETVINELTEELLDKSTPYNKLSKEYMNYESFIVQLLMDKGVIDSSLVDREDPTYIAWAKEEVISLEEYLHYAISKSWIDITKLNVNNQYSDSSEVFNAIIDFVTSNIRSNKDFSKKMYKYMISSGRISGKQICLLLWDQDCINIDEKKIDSLKKGTTSAYNFMLELVSNLEITPAQLALDPCSGSCVVTDVNTGEVLALVSYPGYDINKLANGVDSAYYAKIQKDLSLPQWSAATQQRTAPGSTFKIVSSVAAINEKVVGSLGETIRCTGTFDRMAPALFHCWIYPRGSHGAMNIQSAIANSCNCFFYEVGYRLGLSGSGFSNDYGLSRLRKYADLFGLTEKSGIEIQESEPQFSNELSVPSAIGQGTHNYTTAGLARYVTTIANSGTCYNLSILDKLTDAKGNLIEDYTPQIRNTVELDDKLWKSIHTGMRQVVEKKTSYNDVKVKVAGKTGTAQQDKTRGNHALFISYAPYDNPEVSVTVRIAFGYTSDYAAQTARDVYMYIYGEVDEEELVNGQAQVPMITGQNDD